MAACWNHLQVYSLKCLMVNAGCWQGPQPGPSVRTPTHDLSFWLLGFFTAWWLVSKRASQRARRSCMAYSTQFCKSHSVTLLSSIGRGHYKGPPRFRGWGGHRLTPSLEGRSVHITLQEEHMGWNTLLQPSLENIICHSLYYLKYINNMYDM